MAATAKNTTRVVYPGSGSIFMFLIVLIPFGLVAVFALRMAWVGVWLRDGWPVSLGFAAFAALMIYMIIKLGWYIFGPSMILTPTHIIKPGAFRTHRYPISPQTQVIQWDRRHKQAFKHADGTPTSYKTVEVSQLLMPGKSDLAMQLGSVPHGSGKLDQLIADLNRVAGIKVKHLTPDGLVSDPAPNPAEWPKRDTCARASE